jgi:thiamine biosynthesis lipoprotein
MNPAERASATFGLGEARPERDVLRFSHAAMATVFEVRCLHADAGYARQAAQAAFDLVDRLEMEQSRFIANSDISRINLLAAGQSTRVSPSTLECLETARRMHALTGGAFDVSIGSGLDGLELIPDEFTVHARRGGVRLDLGGIGKGFAIDHMAEELREWDIRHALVHGGFSSVLALEAPPGRHGWPLTLSAPGPGDHGVLARISASRTAFSASGTQKGDHILDPRNGRAVRDRTAWVALSCRDEVATGAACAGGRDAAGRSPATVAEALSTAFMILSAQEIEDLCRRSPGLEAWLILEPTEAGQAVPRLVHVAGPPPEDGGGRPGEP